MKSLALNFVFLIGAGCVVSAAFLLSIPLGLLTIGVPLIAISLHIQSKV